jgi:cephalosporin-C deacetylase-like acetyl esterase
MKRFRFITICLITLLAVSASAFSAPEHAFPAARVFTASELDNGAFVSLPVKGKSPATLRLGWDTENLYLRLGKAPEGARLETEFLGSRWFLESKQGDVSYSRQGANPVSGTVTDAEGIWNAKAAWKDIGETQVTAGRHILMTLRWTVPGAGEVVIPAKSVRHKQLTWGIFFLNDGVSTSDCASTLPMPFIFQVSTNARAGKPFVKLTPDPKTGYFQPCELVFKAITNEDREFRRVSVPGGPAKIDFPPYPGTDTIGAVIRIPALGAKSPAPEYRVLAPGLKTRFFNGAPHWEEPADFDAFWDKARAELKAVPRNIEIEEVPGRATATGRLYKVTMDSVRDVRIACWYFVPKGVDVLNGTSDKRYPALQLVPGYGGEMGATDRTAEGLITLSVNPRGHGPSREFWPLPAVHIRHNLTDPENYYYRNAYLDCLAGIEFLMNRPEVNPKRVGVQGGSQGGALALATAGLDNRVRVCLSNVPSLSDFAISVRQALTGNQYRLREDFQADSEVGRKTRETLSYADCRFLSRRIQCPTLISVGEMDRTCQAEGGAADYNNIPKGVRKRLIIAPNAEHEAPPVYRKAADVWTESYLLR